MEPLMAAERNPSPLVIAMTVKRQLASSAQASGNICGPELITVVGHRNFPPEDGLRSDILWTKGSE